MWTAPDDALLAALAQGDDLAALVLIRRYQQRVFGLARTIISDRHVAEEVAQDTFVRAWRAASSYDARRGPVASWLLAIARNLAIDALRLRRAEPVDPEELVTALLAPAGLDPGEAAARGDEAERLRAALRRLPGPQRRALVQAAFLGRTAREISEVDDIPLGTAKTRIRAAMQGLRSALALERAAE